MKMNIEESAESVIARLNLCAHPEGGFYMKTIAVSVMRSAR